jgi:NTF2 fold immunity protein
MRRLVILLSLLTCLLFGCSYLEDKMAERHPSKHNYNPADGIVPDELTATKIAEIVLKRAYGDEIINRELPLRATLRSDNVWIIRGTWPYSYSSDARGGVATVEITKKDGQIIRMSHGI